MIFSNRASKIASGTNPTLYAVDENNMKLFTFDSQIKESNIVLGKIVRCFGTTKRYNYNQLSKIDSNILSFAIDENISVVIEE